MRTKSLVHHQKLDTMAPKRRYKITRNFPLPPVNLNDQPPHAGLIWPNSIIDDDHYRWLEAMGVLPEQAISQWQSTKDEEFATVDNPDVVVFTLQPFRPSMTNTQ